MGNRDIIGHCFKTSRTVSRYARKACGWDFYNKFFQRRLFAHKNLHLKAALCMHIYNFKIQYFYYIKNIYYWINEIVKYTLLYLYQKRNRQPTFVSLDCYNNYERKFQTRTIIDS